MAKTLIPLSTLVSVGLALTLLASSAAGASPTGTSACTRVQTRAAFDSFLGAFDRGDYTKLDSLFAAEPDFQWFSSQAPGHRPRKSQYDRRALVPYFRARHRHGDRLRLLDFQFNGNSPHWSNFAFDLRRRSSGFRRGHWFSTSGKGAVICDGGDAKLIVISIGAPLPAD